MTTELQLNNVLSFLTSFAMLCLRDYAVLSFLTSFTMLCLRVNVNSSSEC